MNVKPIFQKIKKHWGSIIFYALILFFVFNTDAKSWVLRQVIASGVLNTSIKKDDITQSLSNVTGGLGNLFNK